jgi:Family of unknown function (DUF5995)
VPAGRARTIDGVVKKLRALQRRLPITDGVHWFNRLYLEATLDVREFVRQPGNLEAPPFLEKLDVYFGNAYFAALDAAESGRAPARAWAPLFEARHSQQIAPLQFALAGMNAHVNHDLAIGVVDVAEKLGLAPRGGAKHDYDAVNVLLKAGEQRMKKWLLTDAVAELDHFVAPADDVAAVWSVERARDAAWIRAEVLWRLRELPQLEKAYLAVNDRATGLASRALLVPLGR